MRIVDHILNALDRARNESGFTMIVAVLMLFITSLIVTAAFVGANGDIKSTRRDTDHKRAYYAAMAGISAYKYNLASNSYYWKECKTFKGTVPGVSDETYEVQTVHSESHTQAECEKGKQNAILETSGTASGTFRILATGSAGTGSSKETTKLVATFTHPGFLDYVYFTNYEVLDPAAQNPEPTECEHYYKYRVEHKLTATCGTIVFAKEDKLKGPVHTNDAAALCAEGGSKPVFGRTPSDKIEINGGTYAGGGSCSESAEYLGTYTEEGATLEPPETDDELLESAEDKFKGKTSIELKTGTPNKMLVTESTGAQKTIPFPSNGVVYVENNGSCPVKYTPFNSNYTLDGNCGNVYVKGEYSEPLTIASANDVIITGSITTTHEASGEPTGPATLGLIANNFVRIYHPVKTGETQEWKAANTEQPVGKETCTAPRTRTGTLTSGKKEVTVISPSTTGLNVGEEVSGTGIESGTTISSITNSTTIVLSKSATASGKQTLTFVRTGTLTFGKKEVTAISPSTASLTVGEEVSGTGIESGTTISSITNSTTIVLSKSATASGKQKLTFYKAKYKYRSGQGLCVEEGPSGWEYHESETAYSEACESGSTYTEKGFCEYTEYGGSSSGAGCTSKATNLSSAEDTYKFGSVEPREFKWGTSAMTIDAAILSTKHSFIVDNFKCGSHIGELIVWGSVAQFWRGPVGRGSAGYTKNYNYDDRLETLPPPDFISPNTTKWKMSRVTAPPYNFTG